MATKRKGGWKKKVAIVLAIILAIAFALSFDAPSQFIADKFNIPFDRVKTITKTVVMVSLGLFLISTGAAALVVPIVGGTLIVIGLILVTYGLWPWFRKDVDAVDVQPE